MPATAPDRPDPDALLARVKREETASRRGRLKIWLGAAPGVGKTFAMLLAARRRLAQGLETVVGCVETHGRGETAALLTGLEVMPRKKVVHRDATVEELDLDAALQRRPALLLVDELAHTNVPGSRFPKRWEDVQALLDVGIDVETTLNVQHVESVVDMVAKVTGIQVRETVPDRVIDDAHEVVLVDLPPDALLERLRAGKVYVPDVARNALEGFFKKGNLTALRELALRRTGQWVDGQLQTFRRELGTSRVWGTGERILVAVGPSPLSARLVRAAHRAAVGTRAELFAVFIEVPGSRLSREQRDRVAEHLRLAESLGARTATIESRMPADALIQFARAHDVARIVVGKSGRPRWRELWFGSFPLDVIRKSGDIDVHVVRSSGESPLAVAADADDAGQSRSRDPWWSWRDFAEAMLVVAASSGTAWLIREPADLSTEAMVLVLGIVVVSLRCGRAAALAAVVASALAFNFLLTEPLYTFDIADPGYVFAFLVMLVIGVVITSLVSRAHERAASAQRREHESGALYSLVRELGEAQSEEAVARTTVTHLRDVVPGAVAALVPTAGAPLDAGAIAASHGVPDWLGGAEFGIAQWCFDRGLAAGAGTNHLPGSAALFLPMQGLQGRVGVMAFGAAVAADVRSPRLRILVGTFVEQAALAIERLRQRRAQLDDQRAAETERLRSTLLASVSHDLRTPLATISGSAGALLDREANLTPAQQRELLAGIVHESRRLDELIANLLFATRLDAGEVALRREWTSVEEIVGSALRRASPQLGERPVRTDVQAALPLVEGDPVLLEQALFLLLDNIANHTPPDTNVRVRAFADGGQVAIEVADDGPGIPRELRTRVFDRFERRPGSSGMGLGLAIGAAIAKAHRGTLGLVPEHTPGAAFRLSLPRPPRQPAPPEDA